MDDAAVDSPQPSDEALMLAWARGDAGAFDPLYARHRVRLYRYLVRQLRDPSLADELFQDTWQRVIAARAGWTPDASFATWLYRIAHNRIADHWRARQYRPPAPSDGDERAARIPDPDTPERTLSQFEERRQLQRALDALPDEQREVLLLRLEQELTLEEIGAITGVGRGIHCIAEHAPPALANHPRACRIAGAGGGHRLAAAIAAGAGTRAARGPLRNDARGRPAA